MPGVVDASDNDPNRTGSIDPRSADVKNKEVRVLEKESQGARRPNRHLGSAVPRMVDRFMFGLWRRSFAIVPQLFSVSLYYVQILVFLELPSFVL